MEYVDGLFTDTDGWYDFVQPEPEGQYVAVLDDVRYHPNFDGFKPLFRGALESETVAVFDLEEEEGYIHQNLSQDAKKELVDDLTGDSREISPSYNGSDCDLAKFDIESRDDSSWRNVIDSVWDEVKDSEVEELKRRDMDLRTYRAATKDSY